MCSRKVPIADAQTQTVIRVSPFVFDEYTSSAQVSSDKKMQTQMSISPDQQTEKFYSLLKFMPFRDIEEDSVRVVDLRRKVQLQFTPIVESEKDEAIMFSLADDDGVGDICSQIIHRYGKDKRNKVCLTDAAVQTDINVKPHLLQDEQVANVFRDSDAQTSTDSQLQ